MIAGDVTQIDLPPGVRSGLVDAAELLRNAEDICTCYFTQADVVRHPLVQRIVEAYNQRDSLRAASIPPEPENE